MTARLAAVSLLAALAAPLWTEAADASVAGVVTATVVEDDGTIRLADGRGLRLSGITLADGRFGREAQTFISHFIAASPLTLAGDGAAADRYGRLVAQVYDQDHSWLQGALLRRGLARVATAPDHRAFARDLLAAEQPARVQRLGLWGDSRYALRRAGAVARLVDSWQVVEGTVAAVETRRNAVDLVLGDDRVHDLSVRIPIAVARTMETDPAALAGSRVRVRGWIGKTQGPTITLSHAEQLETLGRAAHRDGMREAE